MKITRKMIYTLIFSITVILLYFSFAVWRCSYIAINSDFANFVLEGKDIISGNFFRNDWNLTGISFITTDLFYYCLGTALFGVSNRAYIFASALMQLALVLGSFLLVKDRMKDDLAQKTGIFFAFVMMPCLAAVYLLRSHTGVFVICFLAIFFYSKINENMICRRKVSFFYVMLLIFGILGDQIILIIVPAAIVIWSFVLWIQKKNSAKEFIYDLGINGLGVAIGMLLDKLYFFIGGANKNGFLEGQRFISWEDVGEKIVLYIRSLFMLADAMFETEVLVQIRTIFYAVNAFAVILFIVIVLTHIIRSIEGKSYDFITTIFGIGFLLMSALFIITTISVDIGSARYLCYFPAMMGIVFVRNLSFLPSKNVRMKGVITILVVIVLFGKVLNLKTDQKGIDYEHIELAQVLEENQLKNGYASFWNASSTTVLSNEEVNVRAILGQPGRMQMMNWFCKNSWYLEPANFVVTEENDMYGVTEENIIQILGIPNKQIDCGKFQILVYDFDITGFLYNGLSDGVITASEWFGNENTTAQGHEKIVLQNGMLYGPYVGLKSGKYDAVLCGKNLQFAEYDIFSVTHGMIRERTQIDAINDYEFSFELLNATSDFEIRIYNSNDEIVVIDKLIINNVVEK